MKIAIVVPCHIPPSARWVEALQREAVASASQVVIVDDSDGNLGQLPETWEVLDYPRQQELLGDDYRFFADTFHKSSSCRIVGHFWAYSKGADVVVGIDSDCIVSEGFVSRHMVALSVTGYGWSNPIAQVGRYSRGYPYSQRNWPVVANMGLWENVLDINGQDRSPDEPKDPRIGSASLSVNGAIPFSGMNFAVTRDVIFGLLFLPNFVSGEDSFRRIDDVWGGYIFQKIIRARRRAILYGAPVVFHDTVVVPEEDAAEEKAMYKHEDQFIDTVDDCFAFGPSSADLAQKSTVELFSDFAHQFYIKGVPPFLELQPVFDWWASVIKKYG